MVGFQPIDEAFREIGAPLRKAVDLMEEHSLAILFFKETCGYNSNVSMVDSIRKFCSRAKEGGFNLNVIAEGEVRRGEGGRRREEGGEGRREERR